MSTNSFLLLVSPLKRKIGCSKRVERFCSNGAKHMKNDANQTAGCGSGMQAEMYSVVEDDMTARVSVINGRIGSKTFMSSEAKEMSRQAQRCIGRFFCETGFDLTTATVPSFQRMINATLGDGQLPYKVPALQD